MSQLQSQKPLQCEYELTRDDLFQFQWRAAYKSPAARRMRRNSYAIIAGAFVVVTLLSLTASWGTRWFWFNLGWWVILFGIITGAVRLFEGRIARRMINKLIDDEKPDKGRIGRHELVLDESGVKERTAVGEQLTRWAGIDRIEQDDSYIYIYTAPSAAHVIPKRAFPSASEASDFFAAATRWRETG
jgi:hypothetical protein